MIVYNYVKEITNEFTSELAKGYYFLSPVIDFSILV